MSETCPKRNFLGHGDRCLHRAGHTPPCKFPVGLAEPVDGAHRHEVALTNAISAVIAEHWWAPLHVRYAAADAAIGVLRADAAPVTADRREVP